MDGNDIGQCPVMHGPTRQKGASTANQHWWPNQLNLKVLQKNLPQIDPMGEDFDYAEAFKALDLDAVKADIFALMTDSQDWWPADYGHYGPLFVRMAWHSAGTYRTIDGRGGGGAGTMRFAPLNSWPDNVNLDKARMLLWPVKQKYGRALSWADLLILTGNCALESMGLKTAGFAGGRADVWEPEQDIYWGPETEWLGDERYSGDRHLERPLGAVQMGLIYVNPEGPNGNPDPIAAARDIRETFARMAMNDEETVALIAGGHTFGKAHGAADADQHVGREPEGAPIEQQGLGWKNSYGSGVGGDAIGSGLEGAWTPTPIAWDTSFFDTLFGYEWKQTKSPAGAVQWIPTDPGAGSAVPDAHDASKSHAPIMFTTDLALREDPSYREISERFHKDHDAFSKAFAEAWYKLTHRDMGPHVRGLGKLVPAEPKIWQDPVPAVDHALIDAGDIADLKSRILGSDLSLSQMVSTAWASAVTFRGSDMRGGANGARIRLAPQKDWAVNKPDELAKVLDVYAAIQSDFNGSAGDKAVSLADLIVLGGCAAVEKAAENAGHATDVPFTPGRNDATQEMTEVDSIAWLEPISDGFRNYADAREGRKTPEALLDRASLMNLSAPEMTALLGGMRMLGTNADGSKHGVFTDRTETLSNDFFVNLLDLGTVWAPAGDGTYEGRDRKGGDVKWTATEVDLVFGANSELRAIAEVYGCNDGGAHLVRDFVAAWDKVMMADRFDL